MQFFGDETFLLLKKRQEERKNKFKIWQLLFKVETLNFKTNFDYDGVTIIFIVLLKFCGSYAKFWNKFIVAIILLLKVFDNLKIFEKNYLIIIFSNIKKMF